MRRRVLELLLQECAAAAIHAIRAAPARRARVLAGGAALAPARGVGVSAGQVAPAVRNLDRSEVMRREHV
jgi:hypothetical protein